MIRRSTLVVIVLFVIAAVALFVLQKMPSNPLGPTPTPVVTSMPNLITGWQAQDAVAVTLNGTNRAEIRLTKNSDNSWTRANLGPVPQGKVEQLLSEILAIRILLPLPAGQNLADLGLQSPIATISITGTGRTATIQIGASTATQSGYYVKTDNNSTAVVDKGSIDTILQLFIDAAPPTPTPPAAPTATAPPS